MKRRAGRVLLSCCLLITFGLSLPVQESDCQSKKNFLWKVQSKGATVYLLGSIHYLKKEMYPLDQKIEKAFEQSAIVVVEANVGDMAEVDVQKLFGNAFYPENETLEQHLSPETYEWVKKELARLGIPPELVQRQKPWLLALTLVSFEISKLGFDPNYGVDKYFLSRAKGEKKILELESLEYQINLFHKLSEKEQKLFLLYTLKDIKVVEQELDNLIKAWASGDEKGLESIVTRSVSEDKGLRPIYEKLIHKRNRNMAAKIEGYLKTKETYFVIVGAGHLVGSQGIIQLLKGKGFSVEQL